MKNTFGRTAVVADEAAVPPPPAARPVLRLDVSLYEKHLAGSDMTEAEKREFLETLWSIIVGFVDLGFGIDPVRQAQDAAACGQNDEMDGSDDVELISWESEVEATKMVKSLQDDIGRITRKGGGK